MKQRVGVKLAAGVFLLWAAGAASGDGTTIRVTPESAATVRDQLAADAGIREVVFAAGIYHSNLSIDGSGDASRPLLLRADDGAEVVFDGSDRSLPLDKAGAVEGRPGVYVIDYVPVGVEVPKLWEPAARVRYQQVADVASVARYPATYAIADKRLFFHTSDGRAPGTGRVQISHAHLDNGLFITRSHVTVRGLTFRNYLARPKWSTAIQLRGDHITVEDCAASNIPLGFSVIGHSNVLRRCRLDDCGGGIYVGGNHALVENCRVVKRRDAFMVPMYEQDDSGIQYYHPATGGILRGNVIQGFARGVTLKCEGTFLVEHNTVIDCHEGILRTVPQKGDRYQRNVMVGCQAPGLGGRLLRPGVVNDGNVFWKAGNTEELLAVLEGARYAGAGRNNIVADPCFVDPAAGDFRLAPRGVSAATSGTERPAGALGAVPADFADRQPPVVRLHLRTPAVPAGAVGRLVFERDPWIGGGTTFIEERREPDPEADYETAEVELNMEVEAADAVGQADTMAWRVDDGPWMEPEAYARRKMLSLPDRGGVHTVAVRVADEAGNWSAPVAVRIRLSRDAVAVAGKPVVYANDHGVVVSFRSTGPSFARVEYSSDGSFGMSREEPQRVHRRWNSNDGGDWVTRWRASSTLHHVALLAPAVRQGATYRYRIVLENAVGRRSTGAEGVFTVAGPARTWAVSEQGRDEDGRGTDTEPVRTLQYAVDRALPGDRVVIGPGVYPGDTLLTHGGVEGAPITVEGASPGKVVLDSARSALCLIRLEQAPHVAIRNLELRGYGQGGSALYIADSPNVSVDGCTIWNGLPGEGWPFGYGIFAHRSPQFTARTNVLYKQEVGLMLLVSPGATIVNNTSCRNLYTGFTMHFSCAGSVLLNNSFTYNQTEQMVIDDPDTRAFQAMVCDYNNLATRIERFDGEKESLSTADPEDPALKRGDASKAIVNIQGTRYRDFATWQKASGKDAHSLFADPQYAGATVGDYRLKAGSPNLRAGRNGVTIGALGVAE